MNIVQHNLDSKRELLKMQQEQGEEHLPTQGWGARQGGGNYCIQFCFCELCLPTSHSSFPKGKQSSANLSPCGWKGLTHNLSSREAQMNRV